MTRSAPVRSFHPRSRPTAPRSAPVRSFHPRPLPTAAGGSQAQLTRGALGGLLLLGALLGGCSKTAPGACTADTQCTAGKCCSGKCVDVQSSVSHCGGCGAACSTQRGAARCTAGVCGITCSSGYGDCNAMAADGCETELTRTANHCGACGKVCAANNAVLLCDRGQCLQSGCKAGFGDCNSNGADGCETDVREAAAHCGACGKKCEPANAVGACLQGLCTIASCASGFGDCDASPGTGCELDLMQSDEHCGGCGNACLNGTKCKEGKCVAPELLFYGGALSLQSTLATPQVSAFNIDSHAWRAVPTTGADTPGSRFAHLAVWDAAASRMLVWGGYLSGNAPADTALYSLDFGSGADGGATASWKKLVTAGGPTQNRGLMGWAWDKASRTLFLYGGSDAANNVIFDELWQLDVAALKWTRRTEPGAPGRRYMVSMVWDAPRSRVLVGHGFDDNYSSMAGFHAFDPALDGGGWSALGASGAPVARAAAPFLGDTQPLYLWAGVDDYGDPLSDLYRLDSADAGEAWAVLQPANPPPPRGYPAAVSTAGGRRFAFGGFRYQGFTPVSLSDVWELSEDAGWEQVADGGINFVHPGAVLGTGIARE